MKSRWIARRSLFILGLGTLTVFLNVAKPPCAGIALERSAGPSHQVIACYFHRTVRCPTCLRISAYLEEAVKTHFPAELRDGSLKLVMMDLQDERNQKFTQAYRISNPSLVIMDVQNGKVVSWKPAPKVWSLVRDKEEFFRYVAQEINSYLGVARTAAR